MNTNGSMIRLAATLLCFPEDFMAGTAALAQAFPLKEIAVDARVKDARPNPVNDGYVVRFKFGGLLMTVSFIDNEGYATCMWFDRHNHPQTKTFKIGSGADRDLAYCHRLLQILWRHGRERHSIAQQTSPKTLRGSATTSTAHVHCADRHASCLSWQRSSHADSMRAA